MLQNESLLSRVTLRSSCQENGVEVCLRLARSCERLCVCVLRRAPQACVPTATNPPKPEKPSPLSSSKAPHNSMSTQAPFKSPFTIVCDNKTEESLASKHNSWQGQMCLLHCTLKCHEGPFLISDSQSQKKVNLFPVPQPCLSSFQMASHALSESHAMLFLLFSAETEQSQCFTCAKFPSHRRMFEKQVDKTDGRVTG